MGFLSGAGQGFNQGVQNLFQNYNQGAELSLQRQQEQRAMEELAMQNKIRQAQLEALAREQSNDAEWKQSFANPIMGDVRQPVPQMQGTVGQGLMAIHPNPEFNVPTRDVTNLMGLLLKDASPYERAIIQGLPNMSAEKGAALLGTILRNREDNTTKENWYNMRKEMDDWRRTNSERDLDRKEKDLERRERVDANKALYDAIRANKGGDGKDTEFDKIYNSYAEQYIAEVKQGLHKGQPLPMKRWEFKKFMDKDNGIPDVPITPPSGTSNQPTTIKYDSKGNRIK